MTVLDWIFIVALLASIALGVWRGFVYEVMSVLNWLLAFVLAQWLGADVGRRLPIDTTSEALVQMAGFVLVFVVSVFLGGLLVWAMPKLIEQAGLRPVDRVLGEHAKVVDDFRAGKKAALGFLVGQVMKSTQGKANPAVVNRLLVEKLPKV